MQSFEDVRTPVDFSCIDLIKQWHYDEYVEDECEVLIRLPVEVISATAVDVEKKFPFNTQQRSNGHQCATENAREKQRRLPPFERKLTSEHVSWPVSYPLQYFEDATLKNCNIWPRQRVASVVDVKI